MSRKITATFRVSQQTACEKMAKLVKLTDGTKLEFNEIGCVDVGVVEVGDIISYSDLERVIDYNAKVKFVTYAK
jgi:hypothetical protein